MDFEEIKKYKDYLEELKSSTSIDERDINLWCDIIEMLCFVNVDRQLFREDLEEEMLKYADGGLQLAAMKDISIQMGYDIDDSHIFNSQNVDLGTEDAPFNDLLNQITNMWFNHLQVRQSLFNEYYPFKISVDNSEITCKSYTRMNKKHRLYLYFLLTSIRSGLTRKKQKRLEFDFEPIAFEAFKSILPQNSESHLMGKGSYTSVQFKVNKYNKFKKLAETLNVEVRIPESYFKLRDSGENGIDFLGWLKFKDELPNNFVYAGQATCMTDWKGKYKESSLDELGGIIDTAKIGNHTNTLFIPYHFKVGKNWAYTSYVEAKKYVLFDRFRILSNIDIRNVSNDLVPNIILLALQS